MQSATPFSAPGHWAGGNATFQSDSSSPPVMSATSGPIQQPAFFWPSHDASLASPTDARAHQPPTPTTARSASQSPTGARQSQPSRALSNAKSTPVLAPGSVRHMANRFNQAGVAMDGARPPQLTIRTNPDKYRRPGVSKAPAHVSPRSPTKSPTKDGPRKLQKPKLMRPKSPVKSPMTSFETGTSFGSTATAGSSKSQPQSALSPKKQHAGADGMPYMTSRPLFGEITADGKWNGNFDLHSHSPLPTFTAAHRRSSDGAVAMTRGRSQSHQDILQPASVARSHINKPLTHKRSRSEMSALHEARTQTSKALPTLKPYPTPQNSSISRIPVPNRGTSRDKVPAAGGHSRSGSSLSNSSSSQPIYSARKALASGKENTNPATTPPRHRYRPPPLPTEANGQTLSAKIVPLPPKKSPELRSSRPRQPVSQATTSASRARAAEQYPSSVAARDGRTPSEQWMGKPYDAHEERSKRKAHKLRELDNIDIDFQGRRDKIVQKLAQNLPAARSFDSLRSKSRSPRLPAAEQEAEPVAAAAASAEADVKAGAQQESPSIKTESIPGEWPTPGGLTVNTFQSPDRKFEEPEIMTASTERTMATEFEGEGEGEGDESPILGRQGEQHGQAPFLTSATYHPSAPKVPQLSTNLSPPASATNFLPSPSVLENVRRMRERSTSRSSSGSERGEAGGNDEEDGAPVSMPDSPSDLGDKWGLGAGLQSVQGSIKIMLDEPFAMHGQTDHEQAQGYAYAASGDMQHGDQGSYFAQSSHSPIEDLDAQYVENQSQETPRKPRGRQDTMRASEYASASADDSEMAAGLDSDEEVRQMLRHYKSTGTITTEMAEQVQKRMLDLQRVSANEGSNGFMIQSLLDSVMNVQQQDQDREQEMEEMPLRRNSFDIPSVTPDTPIGWEFSEDSGTALVYTSEPSNHEDHNGAGDGEETADDFQVRVRKADEAWARKQRASYLRIGGEDYEDKPEPPPKDIGYTPQSSMSGDSETLPLDFAKGLRISTTGHMNPPGLQFAGDDFQQPSLALSSSVPARPKTAHPPLPPPSASATNLPFGLPEVPPIPAAYSERGSSELSPRARKIQWGQSGSSRPSIDSQRATGAPVLPASVSVTSFSGSTRQNSMDIGPDGQTRLTQTTSQPPEQKRLLKRRHIIRELLDTENSYHQDLKIIEDIYRATAVADIVSPEDKKTLFSNCDDIERFSLHFFDELRKAALPVYVPAKKGWANKRGSFSTTQSEGNGQPSDGVDDEKDRTTTIGQAFQRNLPRMEQVYSIYLKNHDAANQRLVALRGSPTVKCWLDECHNHASDITSAWDLDSLLVKPTQRAAKYPMLLQQLLETTPNDHPDREALSAAAKDSVSMLMRINDAKKRADLVDQIVNRKRKESDVRSGIAKAFGRRTEKLKERVGIAETYQDPDFDELAHKFGGHFIRLQICMRDVQDYMNRIEKAVDQIGNYALALDFFVDVSVSPIPELESKWRKYGQAIRDLIAVAFTEHKSAVNKRVIGPMVNCIKLHEGPQNAINDRKRRIVDYAKCKAIEKRGEKPDKKTVDASDVYVALNDQLKIELPKLYTLTASLVQACLNCFLNIQLTWYNTWERKLRPVLEAADFPSSIQQIEPAFRPDYDMVKGQLLTLGICNGSVLADSANFLSPILNSDDASSRKRPSTLDSSKRTMSVGSDASPAPGSATHTRQNSGYVPTLDSLPFPQDGRIRSNSAQSNRAPTQTPGSAVLPPRGWSGNTAGMASPSTRPSTANQPMTPHTSMGPPRAGVETPNSPRPLSGATYFTARPEQPEEYRFSNIFSSAVPQDVVPTTPRSGSPKPAAPDDTPVLFVCASLFEFSIDKTRKEGGYPYLTYVQGEVFDVIAQKGELWLAKNQDDQSNTLGWIWEQHFVILSQE